MAIQTSPSTRTRRSSGTAARPPSSGSRSGTASRAAGQTRRVASTTADEGREVASRAADEGQRVASRAKDQGQAVARTARTETRAVARTAAETTQDVRSTVRTQAAQVREELAAQSRTVVEETRSKIQEQTQTQTRRAAEGLTRLASEAQALAEGRPDEAETIRDYVASSAEKLFEAADRLYGLADDVETRGVEGLVQDLQRFARRRPGAFLVGAAVVGFGVGRAVRSAQSDEDEERADVELDEYATAAPVRRASTGRSRALGGNSQSALDEWGAR